LVSGEWPVEIRVIDRFRSFEVHTAAGRPESSNGTRLFPILGTVSAYRVSSRAMTDQIDEDSRQPRGRDQLAASSATGAGLAEAIRPKRLMRLAIVVAIVLIALAVVVITAAGSSSPPRPGSPHAITTARAVSALLAGIPQRSNTLGQPTARVTLRWYGDLECPFCKEFTLGALPSIVRRWVRGGQLKIEYLSMETATREQKVFQSQQVAALAAGLQDKMWNFIETFYREQGEEDSGYVTDHYLHGIAGQIPGLNVRLWSEDGHDPQLAAQVLAEGLAATRARFSGTPTFLIGASGATLRRFRPGTLTNPRPFEEAIEYLLRGRGTIS
jgi:protein-disulfide isomerase